MLQSKEAKVAINIINIINIFYLKYLNQRMTLIQAINLESSQERLNGMVNNYKKNFNFY